MFQGVRSTTKIHTGCNIQERVAQRHPAQVKCVVGSLTITATQPSYPTVKRGPLCGSQTAARAHTQCVGLTTLSLPHWLILLRTALHTREWIGKALK